MENPLDKILGINSYMADEKPLIPDNNRLLSVYVYYRLSMSVLLSVLFISGLGENILGTYQPSLFVYTSFVYIGFCCLSLTLYLLGMLHAKNNHLLFLLIVDLFALVLMIYAGSHTNVGLGYLLLIPIAIGGTFLKKQTNIGLAAFASLLVLTSSILVVLEGDKSITTIFTAGITGTLLFVTAIAFGLLSKKIRVSERQIQKQLEHSNYLQRIGQRIIETMHAGIIVIDDDLNIQLINNAAKELLSHKVPFYSIRQIKEVYGLLNTWRLTNNTPETTTINLGVNHDIKVSFTNLSDRHLTSVMLFIEDERHINQEAQQLKLASLGLLTASIAHEIRNPLGAISHAAQLLDESEYIHKSDQELLTMVQVNSSRIDQIINNILQFSRRKSAEPEIINLGQWINKFKRDYIKHNTVTIDLLLYKKNVYCRIDPNHLHQIISNLVDNGLKHGQKEMGERSITISTDIDPSSKSPFIDIIDEGEGIDDENTDKIFEPFYTTKKTGSGLGLYLCKELCHANQADIVYFRKNRQQKSCFRLILSQPQRKA